jgi:hypothetical protein
MKSFSPLALTLALVALPMFAAETPKPIRALLVTGGCCHDYGRQKDLLKAGIEARGNIVVDQIHNDDTTGKPPLAIFGNPNYAKGYDVVIHDECAADLRNPTVFESVLKPHLDGIPGVNLHCAMHSYRFGDFTKPVARGSANARWYEYIGLQSNGHGPHEPIAITIVDNDHPITKTLGNWTTIHEELYDNIQILDGKAIAMGKQVVKQHKRQSDGSMTDGRNGRRLDQRIRPEEDARIQHLDRTQHCHCRRRPLSGPRHAGHSLGHGQDPRTRLRQREVGPPSPAAPAIQRKPRARH